jgi:hypothetical protein
MRFSWPVPIVFVTLGLFAAPADAQYIAPNAAASAGGACTNGTYAWPDSSGYLLKCVSGAWTKVAQAGTADYNGTSCTSPNFMSGLDNNMQAICRVPGTYTILAGNTNNTQTAASKTYEAPIEGAMNPVQTATPTQGITLSPISHNGTLQNLQVVTDVANAAGKQVSYQVVVTSPQGNQGVHIYCTINGTSICYDNINTWDVEAGDQVGLEIITDNGGTLVRSSWSLELVYSGRSPNP